MSHPTNVSNRLEALFSQLHHIKLEDIKPLVTNLPLETRMFYGDTCIPLREGLFTFCRLEKGYVALQFLTARSFFIRREDFHTTYKTLQTGFEHVADEAYCSEPSPDYRLAMQLGVICGVRAYLVQLYQSLHEVPSKLLTNCASICDSVKGVVEQMETSEKSDAPWSPLVSLVRSELSILANLLQAQLYTADLHFLDSLLCFTTVAQGLNTMFPVYHSEISQKSGKAKPILLFAWLNNFYNTLLAKYTVYWFHILNQSVGNTEEVVQVVNMEDPSLVNRVTEFQTRTNALSVSLFFDTGCQNYPFLGHGYVLRGTLGDGPKGVESIPPIFTAPLGYALPSVDVFAIVMQISGILNLGEPEELDKLVYSFDEKLNHTYFIRKLEYRVFLAIVYEGCRSAKDRQVTDFISSLVNIIRLQTLCIGLNPH